MFLLAITQKFLQIELNQISYKGIKNKQITPDNGKKVYKKPFFCFVYIIYYKNINKYLIINVNQMGIVLVFGNNNNIYKIKRAKQVSIYGKKVKRIFTIVLSINFGGKVLST